MSRLTGSEHNYWPWYPDEMVPREILEAKATKSAQIIRDAAGLDNKEIFGALVLGSLAQGAGGQFKKIAELPYKEFIYFPLPETSAAGHARMLEIIEVNKKIIVVWRGRPLHYYEGSLVHGDPDREMVGDQRKCTCTSWITSALGAKLLFLTNAAGGPRTDQKEASLVVGEGVDLQGQRDPLLGIKPVVFFDPARRYSKHLNKILIDICKKESAFSDVGITTAITGPCFETDGQIADFLKKDYAAAGMSVAAGKIAAAFKKLLTISFSVITDLLQSPEHTTHEMVLQVAAKAQPYLDRIIPLFFSTVTDEDLRIAFAEAFPGEEYERR